DGGEVAERPRELLSDADGAVAVVPAEQLVTAVAAKRHLHVLARLARQIVRGQRGGVPEGFAEDRRQLRQVLRRVGTHLELVVDRPYMLRYGRGVCALVVARVAEADRE